MSGFEVVGGHYLTDAFDIHLPEGEGVFRLRAPEDAEMVPGEWSPLEGTGEVTSEATEWWSASWWVDGLGTDPDSVPDPDEYDYETWYPGAWYWRFVNDGEPWIYAEIPIVTYSPVMFPAASGLPERGPNMSEIEFESGVGDAVWHIRGSVYGYSMQHTDPQAAQLENCVLKIALVPHSMVVESGDSDTLYPNTQWNWADGWPDRTLLAGLEVVATIPAPAVSDYAWINAGRYDYGYMNLVHDLVIDPDWVVDGRAHFACWVDRDDPDTPWSMDYDTPHSESQNETFTGLTPGLLPPYGHWALDATGQIAGDFSIASDGGLYCSRYAAYLDSYPTTAALSGRIKYSFGPQHDGWVSESHRTSTWTWLSVDTDEFGIALFVYPWAQAIVITPTKIVHTNAGVDTTLAIHSTAFATGDVCEAVIADDTLTVRRGGVDVSTVTVDALFLPYWQYGTHYAWTANPNNRASGYNTASELTTVGDIGIGFELDYPEDDTDPSVFTAPSFTAYRYSHARDYPQFFLEHTLYSLDEPIWCAWLRLRGPSDTWRMWLGWRNAHYGEADPSAYVSNYQPGWARVNRRLDDTAFETEFYGASGGNIGYAFNYLPNGLIRDGGDIPEIYYGTPDAELVGSNPMATYLRIKVQPGDSWHGDWVDLLSYVDKMGGVDYSPTVWHWQPGDDHDGLQDIGYAHGPQTAMKTGPSRPSRGMAMEFQSSVEEWLYNGREGVYGYTEADGPFFYGWLSPFGAGFEIFDDDAIYNYDHGQTSGEDGSVFGKLTWKKDWSGAMYGEQYDILYGNYYHDTYGYPLHGIDYQLVGSDESHFHDLQGPGGYSLQLGTVIPPDNHPWYSYRANREFVMALVLPAFPDSVFVQWAQLRVAGDYVDVIYITKRLNRATAAVEADYSTSFSELLGTPYDNTGNYGLSYAQASPDGRRICFANNGGGHSAGDMLTHYSMFNIAAPYSHDYLSQGINMFWTPDNSTLYVPSLGYDVWLEAQRVAAGTFGLTSDYNETEGFWGEVCIAQTQIQCIAAVTLAFGIKFYDEDRVLLDEQWSAPTAFAGGATSDITFSVTPPDNTVWTRMSVRCTAGGSEFSIKHPGIWRPGRMTGARTFQTLPTTPTKYYEWDPATDTFIVRPANNLISTELMGFTLGGRLVNGYAYRDPSLWDPATDVSTYLFFEPYEGKGYNGGFIGTDGRYLYYQQLNYHVAPNSYTLTAADIAKIDPDATGAWESAGDVVDVGNGIAEAFNEFYRYDLHDLSFYPSAPYKIAYFIFDTAVGFHPDTGDGIYYSYIDGVENNYRPDLFTATISGSDLTIGSHAPYSVHIANAGPSGFAGTVACFINAFTGAVDWQLWASSMTYGGADYDLGYVDDYAWWDETDEGFPLMSPPGASAGPGPDRYATYDPTGTGSTYWQYGVNGGHVVAAQHAQAGGTIFAMNSLVIGPDTDYGVRHGPLPIGPIATLESIIVETVMASFHGGAYGRMKVTYCDVDGSVLAVDEGAVEQYLVVAEGFTTTVQLQSDVLNWAHHIYIDLIWRWVPGTGGFYEDESGGGGVHPYGQWSALTVKAADGSLPIEYLFNVDPALKQSNGTWIEPQYNISPANMLDHDQWLPGSLDGFNWTAVHGGVISVTKDAYGIKIDPTTESEIILRTNPIPFSRWRYGIGDYWTGSARMYTEGYDIVGTVDVTLVLYNTAGVEIGRMPVFPIASIDSGGSGHAGWTIIHAWDPSYPNAYPSYYAPAATQIGLEFHFRSLDPDVLIWLDHFNISPENTSSFDRDPLLGDVKTRRGYRPWLNVTTQGICYDFSWWGWKQAFQPLSGGEGPEVGFDRYLTDSTKPPREIGFTRNASGIYTPS